MYQDDDTILDGSPSVGGNKVNELNTTTIKSQVIVDESDLVPVDEDYEELKKDDFEEIIMD